MVHKNIRLRDHWKIIDLLDENDLVQLKEKWRIEGELKKDSDEFYYIIDKISKTSFILDILSIKSPTLIMIQDIVRFLSCQNSSIRTTGGIIVLEEEFKLSPQQINSILKWSQKILDQQTESLWDEIIQIWNTEIKSIFNRIKSKSEIDVIRKKEDIVKAYIKIMAGSRSNGRIRTITTVEYNKKWLDIYEKYIDKLKKFNFSLSKLMDRDLDEKVNKFIRDVKHTFVNHKNTVSKYYDDIQHADNLYNRQGYENKLSKEEEETWTKFIEKVQFISDIEESTDILDLLRIDLFRNRPQLYEIWILVFIINCFKWNGFSVELLNIERIESGRMSWNLNYSKSTKPVAKFTSRCDQSEYFLFYQLYRKGDYRDEMPDIALMPNSSPNSEPVWIIDPKHSEKKSYSISYYKKVALRYHTQFKPKYTWIVEYYPRLDIGTDNPLFIEEKVELIKDLSPNGTGKDILLSILKNIHVSNFVKTVVIDVSSSFIANINKVRHDLIKLYNDGELFNNKFIVFSDSAKEIDGLLILLNEETIWPEFNFSHGTLISPVLILMEELNRKGYISQDIIIYTDLDFQDEERDKVISILSQYGNVVIKKGNDL